MRVISGRAKGALLRASAPGVRPTSSRVRNALFSALGPGAICGLRVLDLYAGTGSLGMEALSRGADFARFVERNRRQCESIRESLEASKLSDQAGVSCMTVKRYLQRAEGPFDLVIADPPYSIGNAAEILAELVARGLVRVGGDVILEHSSRNPVPQPAGLLLSSSRRYGDTALSFYSPTSGTEPEHGP